MSVTSVARIPTAAAPAPEPVQLDAARILDFYATVAAHPRFIEAATALAAQCVRELRLDRASVGLVDRGHVELAALSDSADFERGSEIARALADAMDEALAQNAVAAHPPLAGARQQITAAHAALARRHGGAVCTVPLVANGAVVGALTFERFDAPFLRAEIPHFEQLACFVGPMLELKRDNERPWTRRVRDRLGAAWAYLRAPGHNAARAGAAGALLALLGLLLVPVDYHVRAPARLEGAVQRVLVAPMDGFLRQANVRPGDVVRAGDVVAELADQDLQIELRRRRSELAQHESAYLSAFARAERTQYGIAHAKAAEVRAQLELVERQLERSRVQAPFDGIVIKGDLHRALGAPVQRGEVLLTIAPGNEFRLIVDVDERDVARVARGQKGRLALAAMPERTLAFTVDRVTPVATARDARTYFEVVGVLDDAALPALRPGLEGVARIGVAQRPLVWIALHRFADWLRITLWSWGA